MKEYSFWDGPRYMLSSTPWLLYVVLESAQP